MPGWHLILFSLIVQACVGTIVWMEILQLSAANRDGAALPDSVRQNAMWGITIGIAAAILVSLMHLGNPIRSVFTLNNLRTSWLSREILLLILFASGVAFGTVMHWRGWGSETTRKIINGGSALLGLGLVFVMAKLYMLPTTPGWNTAATPISFYATAMILGGTIFLAALVCRQSNLQSQDDTTVIGERSQRIFVFALVFCLGVEIALAPFLAGTLFRHSTIGQAYDVAFMNLLLTVRVLIVAATLGILLRLVWSAPDRPKRWITVTIVLVVTAEIIGRYTFYASYYRIGV